MMYAIVYSLDIKKMYRKLMALEQNKSLLEEDRVMFENAVDDLLDYLMALTDGESRVNSKFGMKNKDAVNAAAIEMKILQSLKDAGKGQEKDPELKKMIQMLNNDINRLTMIDMNLVETNPLHLKTDNKHVKTDNKHDLKHALDQIDPLVENKCWSVRKGPSYDTLRIKCIARDGKEMDSFYNDLEQSNHKIHGWPSDQYTNMMKELDEVRKFAGKLKTELADKGKNPDISRISEKYEKMLVDLEQKAQAYLTYKNRKTKNGKRASIVEKERLGYADKIREFAALRRLTIHGQMRQIDIVKEARNIAVKENQDYGKRLDRAAELSTMALFESAQEDSFNGEQKEQKIHFAQLFNGKEQAINSIFGNQKMTPEQMEKEYSNLFSKMILGALMNPAGRNSVRECLDMFARTGFIEQDLLVFGKEEYDNLNKKMTDDQIRLEAATKLLQQISHDSYITGKEGGYEMILRKLLKDAEAPGVNHFNEKQKKQLQSAKTMMHIIAEGVDAWKQLQEDGKKVIGQTKLSSQKTDELIEKVLAARVMKTAMNQSVRIHLDNVNSVFEMMESSAEQFRKAMEETARYKKFMENNSAGVRMKLLRSNNDEMNQMIKEIAETTVRTLNGKGLQNADNKIPEKPQGRGI